MAKNKTNGPVIVYSTNPDFNTEEEEETISTPKPGDQRLFIKRETKHRAGKVVTLLMGFSGTETDKNDLGKKLKNYCGSGGSVKEDEILVQGDHREKMLQWLLKNGYTNVKSI